MKVAALYCYVCDTTIYSRANHDYHHCNCDNPDYSLMVDAGPGTKYVRYGWGNLADRPESFILNINATIKELYDDWNYGRNKYGWIKGNAKKRKAKVPKRTKSSSKSQKL